MTLSDVRGPTLGIICAACGRSGRYTVERLMAEHGDAKLTDLLVTLADCPKACSFNLRPLQGEVRGALGTTLAIPTLPAQVI